MRAGVYCRLSVLKPSEQLTEAALERQEADCRALCVRNGWEVVQVYPDEGLSAYSNRRRRPGFELALSDLEAGRIDVLVCWKLDRLVRRLKDWIRVEEVVERSGGKLMSVNEGEQSQLTLRILASMAEQESKNTSDRVGRQREQAARAGEPNQGGRRLFGYTTLPRTIKEDEAAVIREVVRRLLAGESVRSLTSWANTVSVTPTGRQWTQQTLRGMLLSPALAGLRVYKGVVVAQGVWEPILDRPTWEAVNALLRDPSRITPRGRPSPWLLASMVECGRCHSTMVVHYRVKSRGGAREYLCFNKPGTSACGLTTVAAEPLEALVEEMVLQQLAEDRLDKALTAHDGIVTELHQQREVIKAKLREVGEMFDTDEIDRAEYLERRAKLTERLGRVQADLDRHLQRSILTELPTAEAELRAWWSNKATPDQKQSVMRACLRSVVVGPARVRGGRFDSNRVLPPYGPQWRF
jgi:DNA invertase Pin-like site-specific DNA recombinase